jgi:Leucine-rich repeat (LRR) protein
MASKRTKRACIEFPDLSSDVHGLIFTFVVDSWGSLDNLRFVSKDFQMVVRQPMMVSGIHFDFHQLEELLQFQSVLTGIRTLQLHKIDNLQANSLACLTALRSLTISGCDALTKIEQLSHSEPLRSLDLSFCADLNDLEGLSDRFPQLDTVDLTMTNIVDESLHPLLSLRTLKKLSLSLCSVTRLRPLSNSFSLQHLDLSSCVELLDEALADIARLPDLRQLNLQNCGLIEDVSALATLSSLSILNLRNTRVACITALSSLPKLRSLNLVNCYHLRTLCAMLTLETVDLKYCPAAKDYRNLESCDRLRELHVGGVCFPDFRALKCMKSLIALYVYSCNEITLNELQSVLSFPSLAVLELYNCARITSAGVKTLQLGRPSLRIRTSLTC